MMILSAKPLNLTLRHAFATSRSTQHVAENVLVEIPYGGLVGLGEAAPISFYNQTQSSCIRALQKMARQIEKRDPFELQEILTGLKARFPNEPSAVGAVDIALHDLIGKKQRVPTWKLWGLDPRKTPHTSFTIGIDSMEKVVAKIAEAERFPVLKVKVGTANDLEIMREVRRLAPKKVLRVDANCGWSVPEAIRKAKVLEKLGIEFIEQPIP